MKNETTDTVAEASTSITVPAAQLRTSLIGLCKLLGKGASPNSRGDIRVSTLSNGSIDLMAGDGGRWASVRLAAAGHAPPCVSILPVADLKGLLARKKPGDLVDVTTSVVAAGVTKYPTPPTLRGKAHVLKPGITRAITEAARCASTDPQRQILNGVHLDTTGDKGTHIVATDGRVLYWAGGIELPVTKPITLGAHPLLTWKSFMGTGEWKLRVSTARSGGGHYELTSGSWRIIGMLLKGSYPAWRQVVPKRSGFKARAIFDHDRLPELAKAVGKLPVAVTRSGGYRPIALVGDGKSLTLRWHSAEDGTACEMGAPIVPGGKGSIDVLLDRDRLAKAFTMGFEEMQVIDDLSPVKFVGEGGRQMVIMPLRPGTTGAPTVKKRQRHPTRPRQEAAPKPQGHAPRKPPSEPKPTPRLPMPNTDTPHNGSNGSTHPKDEPPLDTALRELSMTRERLREANTTLGAAMSHLKKARAEHRSTNKEIRSVRSTLKSLGKIRL